MLTIRTAMLGGALLDMNRINYPNLAAWLITVLVFMFGFRFVRFVAGGILSKLHEFLIQTNIFGR